MNATESTSIVRGGDSTESGSQEEPGRKGGPTILAGAIRRGHYAAKQIHCRDPLIAWSHTRRFLLALDLAGEYLRPGIRLLDHGCGDGTFLALLLRDGAAGLTAVGSEIAGDLVRDCRARIPLPGLEFMETSALLAPEHAGRYDLITCMEVLEHVVEIDAEIELLSRLLAPGGVLIVSVPVETGLPLALKQVMRRIAGWRGLGDYPGDSPYSVGELLSGIFAGARPHMKRPVFPTGDLPPHHSHKGFNWMDLRQRLERRFDVERVLASPVRSLPPHLNSQAWFIARKRNED